MSVTASHSPYVFLCCVRVSNMSLPCSCRQRNNVLQTFLRVNEDAELRIAAYLAAMQCPTEGVVQQVRDALLSEEVNQVSRNVSSVCV